MRRSAFLILTLSIVAACGSSTGPSNGNSTTGDFDVTIGSGRNPTYTWSGGNAFSVTVVRVSAPGTPVWGLANPTNMSITSPVTHGTSNGAGTLVSVNTESTLTTGVAYRVSVTRADQKTGFKEFTP